MKYQERKIKLFEGSLLVNEIYISSYNSSKMLLEYRMTQQQIADAFEFAAKSMNDEKFRKANRTAFGKAADSISSINAAWEKVKTNIQNSKKVQGFDDWFENIQSKILNAAGGKEGAVGKALTTYKNFADKHPIMQGAVYAGLIALAGISGAGLGGAALLGGIKLFDRLLQGDKASSALWKGFKTGAVSYAAGQVGNQIRGGAQVPDAQPTTNIRAGATSNPSDFTDSPKAAAVSNATNYDAHVPDEPETTKRVASAGTDPVQTVTGTPAKDVQVKRGDTLSTLAKQNNVSIKDILDVNPKLADNPNLIKAGDTIKMPAATGNPTYQDGVGTAKDIARRVAAAKTKTTESAYDNTKYVDWVKTYKHSQLNENKNVPMKIFITEQGIVKIFELIEEGVFDWLKKQGQRIGGNITSKVTFDKLQKSWNSGPGARLQGSNRSVDSRTIFDFLIQQGVHPAVAKSTVDKFKPKTAAPASVQEPKIATEPVSTEPAKAKGKTKKFPKGKRTVIKSPEWSDVKPKLQTALKSNKFYSAAQLVKKSNLDKQAKLKILNAINVKSFEQALRAGKVDIAKQILDKKFKNPSAFMKRYLSKILTSGKAELLSHEEWSNLSKAIMKESVFKTISKLLIEYNLTWGDFGYTKVVKSSKNKIILLNEYASGGSTSAGNIASVPNAGNMPLIRRMPAGQSFFAPQPVKKRRKKRKK